MGKGWTTDRTWSAVCSLILTWDSEESKNTPSEPGLMAQLLQTKAWISLQEQGDLCQLLDHQPGDILET